MGCSKLSHKIRYLYTYYIQIYMLYEERRLKRNDIKRFRAIIRENKQNDNKQKPNKKK